MAKDEKTKGVGPDGKQQNTPDKSKTTTIRTDESKTKTTTTPTESKTKIATNESEIKTTTTTTLKTTFKMVPKPPNNKRAQSNQAAAKPQGVMKARRKRRSGSPIVVVPVKKGEKERTADTRPQAVPKPRIRRSTSPMVVIPAKRKEVVESDESSLDRWPSSELEERTDTGVESFQNDEDAGGYGVDNRTSSPSQSQPSPMPSRMSTPPASPQKITYNFGASVLKPQKRKAAGGLDSQTRKKQNKGFEKSKALAKARRTPQNEEEVKATDEDQDQNISNAPAKSSPAQRRKSPSTTPATAPHFIIHEPLTNNNITTLPSVVTKKIATTVMGTAASKIINKKKGKKTRSPATMGEKSRDSKPPSKASPVSTSGNESSSDREWATESTPDFQRQLDYASFSSLEDDVVRDAGSLLSSHRIVTPTVGEKSMTMAERVAAMKAKLDKRKKERESEEREKSVQEYKRKRDQEANETSKKLRLDLFGDQGCDELGTQAALEKKWLTQKKEKSGGNRGTEIWNPFTKPTTEKIMLKIPFGRHKDTTKENNAFFKPRDAEEEHRQFAEALSASLSPDDTAEAEEAIVELVMEASRRDYEASRGESETSQVGSEGSKMSKTGTETSKTGSEASQATPKERARRHEAPSPELMGGTSPPELVNGDAAVNRDGAGDEATSNSERGHENISEEEELPLNPDPNWYNDRTAPEILFRPSTSNPLGRYSVQHLHRVLEGSARKGRRRQVDGGKERKGG